MSWGSRTRTGAVLLGGSARRCLRSASPPRGVNVAQCWSHGLVGAAAAAWPAVALVGSYEMLAWMVRTTAGSGPDRVPSPGHAVQQPDHHGVRRRFAGSPARETVTVVKPAAGAGSEPGSVPEPVCVAHAAAQVREPGPAGPRRAGPRPAGPGGSDQAGPGGSDQAGQAGGPVDECTGPRGQMSPGHAAVTLPSRCRPGTSTPPQQLPTAPVSRGASRCRSASSRRLSDRFHGGGRVPGWRGTGGAADPVRLERLGG